MKVFKKFRFLLLSTIAVAFIAPAFGMVIVGDESANTRSKDLGRGNSPSSRAAGKNLESAICLLDIIYLDKSIFGSCALISINQKEKTGLILTAAHGFLREVEMMAVGISFGANPVADLDRIMASHYVTHPDYNVTTKIGPDLALVRFPLPEGFSIPPMRPSTGVDAQSQDQDALFMIGGFGNFALNGETIWRSTLEDFRAKRVGYLFAKYTPSEETLIQRNSFESSNAVHSKEELLKLGKGPVRFLPNPRFQEQEGQPESVMTPGDSGGPVFYYSAEEKRFILVAVLATMAGVVDTDTQTYEHVTNMVAITADAFQWILSAARGAMKPLEHNAIMSQLNKAIYRNDFAAILGQ